MPLTNVAPSDKAGLNGSLDVGAIKAGMSNLGGMEVMGITPGKEGEYGIMGDRYSVISKVLAPGQAMQMETGVMMYMSNDCKMKAQFGGWRMFSGEGLAKLKVTNEGSEPGYVGMSPNMPMSVVIPLDMQEVGELNCKRGAYLAGDPGIRVRPKFLQAASCMACCCGGMPPIIQSIGGTGTAFMNAGGTVVKKQLAPGECILVDSDAVVAFSNGISYDVKTVGSCLTCCLGGEGCFNTELTGEGSGGYVYLQSLSYEKLIKMLIKAKGGKGKDKAGGGDGAPPISDEMDR